MTKGKTSNAQKRAIKNWRKKNPEASRINSYRATAKTFARHYATPEEMADINDIFKKENKNYED